MWELKLKIHRIIWTGINVFINNQMQNIIDVWFLTVWHFFRDLCDWQLWPCLQGPDRRILFQNSAAIWTGRLVSDMRAGTLSDWTTRIIHLLKRKKEWTEERKNRGKNERTEKRKNERPKQSNKQTKNETKKGWRSFTSNRFSAEFMNVDCSIFVFLFSQG